MTRILLHGAIRKNDNESGYILLRGLMVMFVIILCFAVVLSGIAVLSHRSAVLLDTVEKEIRNRNEIVLRIIK
jgi:hypothetical protein